MVAMTKYQNTFISIVLCDSHHQKINDLIGRVAAITKKSKHQDDLIGCVAAITKKSKNQDDLIGRFHCFKMR